MPIKSGPNLYHHQPFKHGGKRVKRAQKRRNLSASRRYN